ncbi:heterokaryon incompatibility protein-domain-containing protein [Hyaloscypha sp. PMI_1271]|nr:heterokaryon incompatibility protein-domain-containing protein [Hyaloscypha sp. PMI_1271]
MYTYNPFTSPNTIRLLEVQLKGNDYGKLQTYLLDNAPEFIALSYTWGCPYSNPNYELEDSADTAALNSQYTANRTIPITVDGAILMVSENCKDAIDNIKEHYNSGNFHICIDAVCINQEDLDERAAQVSIMGHIYSKAFRVIIWLGNSLYNTKRALEFIDAISQIPDEHLAANETVYTIALENIRNRQHHHKAQRLENPCFVFGKNLVPTLESVALVDTEEAKFVPLMQSTYAAKGSIWLQAFFMTYLRTVLWADEGENDVKLPLMSSIQPVQSRSATDNRDKVYGVLDGINRILEKRPDIGPVVPNYNPSNTVSAVFTDLTYRAIRFDENLLVLSLIHDEAFRDVHNLPSWALDLSRVGYPSARIEKPPSEDTLSIRLPTFLYLEHQYKEPNIINQFSLCVQGIMVDHIIDRADPFHNIDGAQVFPWLKLATQLDNPYHSNEGPTEVLWRTLISNTARTDYPAPSSLGERFHLYLISLLLIAPDPRDAFEESTKRLQKSKDSLILMESLNQS